LSEIGKLWLLYNDMLIISAFLQAEWHLLIAKVNFAEMGVFVHCGLNVTSAEP